ncbi:MAG TPA: cytochrome c [Steroidobacteraceae bacterium]
MSRARIALLSGALALASAMAWGQSPPEAATPAADADQVGQKLYARHCLSCHQADGYGVPNMQPAIKGGTWVKGDPKALALFVMTGGFDSAGRKEGAGSHNVMPSFRQLPDEELAGILSYIRGKFGDGASAVTPAVVAEARATLPPG